MRNRFYEIIIAIFCFTLTIFAQEERKHFLSPFVGCGFSLARLPIEIPNGQHLSSFEQFSMDAICQAFFETNQDIYLGLEFGIISPYNYSYGRYIDPSPIQAGFILPTTSKFAKLGLAGIVTEIKNNNIFCNYSRSTEHYMLG